jgi:hypothetical protein
LSVIHADPERQFWHELTLRGVPDGPIQFYRSDHGGMASISFKSIYRAARRRTDLGDKFPELAKCHSPMTEEDKIRSKFTRRQPQDGVSEASGYPSTSQKSRRVRKADQCTQ